MQSGNIEIKKVENTKGVSNFVQSALIYMLQCDQPIIRRYIYGLSESNPIMGDCERTKTVLCTKEAVRASDLILAFKHGDGFSHFFVTMLYAYLGNNPIAVNFVESRFAIYKEVFAQVDAKKEELNSSPSIKISPSTINDIFVDEINEYNTICAKGNDSLKIEIESIEKFNHFLKFLRMITLDVVDKHKIYCNAGAGSKAPVKASPFDFAVHYPTIFNTCDNESRKVLIKLCANCVELAGVKPATKGKGKTGEGKSSTKSEKKPKDDDKSTNAALEPPPLDGDEGENATAW